MRDGERLTCPTRVFAVVAAARQRQMRADEQEREQDRRNREHRDPKKAMG